MQSLLRTKLFVPPIHPETISRPRLVQQLNHSQTGKLSLVTAPAGYGKTTLVISWLHQLMETEAVWLSLDEGDNDLRRFFTYLVATLGQLDQAFETVQQAFLQDLHGELSPKAIVTELLNQAAAYGQSAVLILDDYHEIEEPSIHEALSFWLDNQPPNLHLVITSRTEPPLPLPRMRVRRQVTEVNAEALRFSQAEAAEFLNQHMHLDLSTDDIAQLDSVTEGWVASLQLAALSLQNQEDPTEFIRTFKGDNRYIVDYLVSEVLHRQPGYIRDFMLQTSILERLNVQLCNAVTGQVGGQHILETLDQARLFVIPLDDQRHWYRYHHLFAECLQTELRRTAAEDIAIYHERASRWLSDQGHLREAIQHAFAVDNYDLAADLIANNARTLLWARGERQRPWEWIQQLPDNVVCTHPQLLITKAWLYQELFLTHDQRIADLLHQASALLEAPNSGIAADDSRAMATEIALAHWNIERLRGNLQQALEHCTHAFALIQGVNEPQLQTGARHSLALTHHQLGNVKESIKYSNELFEPEDHKKPLDHARFVSLAYRIDALRLNGQLNAADQTCRQIKQLLPSRDNTHHHNSGSAMLAISWCEVLRERNELDMSLDYLIPAIEFLRPLHSMAAVVQTGMITLARIYQAQGRAQEALALLSDGLRDLGGTDIYYPSARVSAIQALLHLQQGNPAAATAWAAASGLDAADTPTYLREIDYLVLARVLIFDGQTQAAQVLLKQIEKAASAGGRLARVIEVMVLQALAHQAAGKGEQAIGCMGEAVALAEPAGYIRLFVDEGDSLVPLLKQVAGRGVSVEPIRHLLSHIDGESIRRPQIAPHSQIDNLSAGNGQTHADTLLLNPLTDRELATLRYLASDLTIPGIAEQMVVAPSTIRTYVKRIYSKLDVHNRIEAVNRARSLSLLG